jgi:bifunctional UDP-N-acetylglucosamine pyrophosphorylase / glucosamine-1-phosphate N-acetyltransferase
MRSRLPKVLHAICGRPMLRYVIDAAEEVTGSQPVVVYSPPTAAICDVFAGRARFALQEEPRGTGDALRAGLAAVPDNVDEILVLSGDVPLVRVEELHELLDARRQDHAALALTAVMTLDPAGLGRVLRNDAGSVERIVEERDATEDEREISEINAGLYVFDAPWLRSGIARLAPSSATGELYLTRLVAALDVDDDGRLLGINDRAQLAQAEWDLRTELNTEHMRNGVTMQDPSTVYLDADVELAPDVTLEPNVILRGATRVGEGTVIGAGSQIFASRIGANARVWASVIESSEVDDEATVGPFAHLRPGSIVGPRGEIGNFAEIKNSRLAADVKQHHMSYLGDAEVGAGTNVGAGTITANYDGTAKHRTTIGERVFLGVDTMLRAPITLGDDSRTGAGAVVTKDVPPGMLAVGVPARLRTPRQKEPPAAADPVAE